MRCFFCLEEKEPSLEHVFPDAIGGTLTTLRVCKPCNDILGARVDVLLADHPAILFRRAELEMSTGKGNTLDPLRRMFHICALASDPDKRIQLVPDAEAGQLVPKMMYYRRETEHGDGLKKIEVTLDESEIEQLRVIVQRERKRGGLEPLQDTEIEALIEAARQNIGTIEQPSVHYELKIDIHEFKRGVCKIIYELACMWLGDAYLDDPIAAQFRDFVLSGAEQDIRGEIKLHGDVSPLNLWRSESEAHVALASKQGQDIWVAVRIFNSISGVLRVTTEAAKYADLADGRFYLMNLTRGTLRHSTLNEEFLRMIRQGRSQTSAD